MRSSEAQTIAIELGNAFRDALAFVADLRDTRANEVHGDTSLREAALTEALATLAHRPRIAEALAEVFAPRQCERQGCRNDAEGARAFCSGPCEQWQRRERERAERCLGPNCFGKADPGRVFCSPVCKDRFPANRKYRELVAA